MLDQQDVPLDQVFRALANASRRAMLARLANGPASVGELARPLDMTLSAVDQHARVLESCGLIRTHKHGRVRACRLEPETLGVAERWLADRRSTWERRLDRLGDFLAEAGDEGEDDE